MKETVYKIRCNNITFYINRMDVASIMWNIIESAPEGEEAQITVTRYEVEAD